MFERRGGAVPVDHVEYLVGFLALEEHHADPLPARPGRFACRGRLGGLGVLDLEGLWTRYEDPTEQLDRMRIDLEVVITRGDTSLRRLAELADLVITCCLGIVQDRTQSLEYETSLQQAKLAAEQARDAVEDASDEVEVRTAIEQTPTQLGVTVSKTVPNHFGRLLGLPERPSEKTTRELAEPWRPLRGAAAHLWWAYYRVLRNREGVIAGAK